MQCHFQPLNYDEKGAKQKGGCYECAWAGRYTGGRQRMTATRSFLARQTILLNWVWYTQLSMGASGTTIQSHSLDSEILEPFRSYYLLIHWTILEGKILTQLVFSWMGEDSAYSLWSLWTWRDAFSISRGYGAGSLKMEMTAGAWLLACFRLQVVGFNSLWLLSWG